MAAVMEAEAGFSSGNRGKDPEFIFEARQELERLISDPDFQCTIRNKKFLAYIAEQFFQGREDGIKAYSIAVDVFERPPSFDPTTDPIVRIEATRLRAALLRYYEFRGRARSIRVELPPGHYIPSFIKTDMVVRSSTEDFPGEYPATEALPSIPQTTPADPELWRLHPSTRAKWVSILAGIVGGTLAAAFFFADFTGGTDVPVVSDKPSVSIDLRSDGGTSDAEAMELRDTLIVALSRFGALRILSPDIVSGALNRHPPLSTETQGRKYHLLLKYEAGPPASSVMWQVIDLQNGETVRSGSEKVATRMSAPSDIEEELVSRLTFRIASARGVINEAEATQEALHPTFGNGCVVRAYPALDSGDASALGTVRSCLEKTLETRPGDADAYALLSGVLLRMTPPEAPPQLADQALSYASQAIGLAPDSDRSHFAMMMAQFRTGHPDAAIFEGYRAIALNPYNFRVAARLGTILFTVGRWNEAVTLVRKASQFDYASFPRIESILAFDAYRRGAFDEAISHLQRASDSNAYSDQLLRIATLGQLGRIQEANSAIAALRKARPGFERSFQADMAKRQLAQPLVDALEIGLSKAGLKLQ